MKFSDDCVVICIVLYSHVIDGLMQDCSTSSALAMEILQRCTKPSSCSQLIKVTCLCIFLRDTLELGQFWACLGGSRAMLKWIGKLIGIQLHTKHNAPRAMCVHLHVFRKLLYKQMDQLITRISPTVLNESRCLFLKYRPIFSINLWSKCMVYLGVIFMVATGHLNKHNYVVYLGKAVLNINILLYSSINIASSKSMKTLPVVI